MLSDYLIPKLQERFPGRGLRIGRPPDPCAVFPAMHPEVGDVVIQDDGSELTLIAGNFTHGHFSNYDTKLTQQQKEERIAEDVVRFLEDLFADRIALWGSHRGVGGWCKRDLPSESELRLLMDRAKKCVWSGPISSD
jgi:hypothetical protein